MFIKERCWTRGKFSIINFQLSIKCQFINFQTFENWSLKIEN